MFSLSKSLSLLAFASFATAQLSLTSQCTKTLASLATDPDVENCLTPTPLLAIFTSPSSSVIGPIDNWLKSLCATGPCSNSTLAKVVAAVTSGCPTEAAGLGIQSGDAGAVTQIVQQFYPAVRQAVCLKDGSTNCVTQTLTNIQNINGVLNVNELGNLVSGGYNSSNIPANVTCTNCVKAAYNILQPTAPSAIPSSTLQAECGASFVDGKMPDGIVETASNTTSASSNGNSGSHALVYNGASGLSALLVTFGAFTLLG